MKQNEEKAKKLLKTTKEAKKKSEEALDDHPFEEPSPTIGRRFSSRFARNLDKEAQPKDDIKEELRSLLEAIKCMTSAQMETNSMLKKTVSASSTNSPVEAVVTINTVKPAPIKEPAPPTIEPVLEPVNNIKPVPTTEPVLTKSQIIPDHWLERSIIDDDNESYMDYGEDYCGLQDDIVDLDNEAITYSAIEKMVSKQIRDEVDKQVTNIVQKLNHENQKKIESIVNIKTQNYSNNLLSHEQRIFHLERANAHLQTQLLNTKVREEDRDSPVPHPENLGGSNTNTNVTDSSQNNTGSDQIRHRRGQTIGPPDALRGIEEDEDPHFPGLGNPGNNQWQKQFSRKRNPIKAATKPHTVEPNARTKRIGEIISKADTTVGLRPITERRIKQAARNKKYDGLSDKVRNEKAHREVVNEFLESEMGLSKEELEKVQTFTAFRPVINTNDITYIKLGNSELRKIITRKAGNLDGHGRSQTENPQMVRYIPKELYLRYKALKQHCKDLRKNQSRPMATSIGLSDQDFTLKQRPAEGHPDWNPDSIPQPWIYIDCSPLPALPEINLSTKKVPHTTTTGRAPTPPSPPPIQLPREEVETNFMDEEVDDDIDQLQSNPDYIASTATQPGSNKMQVLDPAILMPPPCVIPKRPLSLNSQGSSELNLRPNRYQRLGSDDSSETADNAGIEANVTIAENTTAGRTSSCQ